jgi:hypothetical protein
MVRIDRRLVLGLLGGAAAAPLLPQGALAASPGPFTMWRDPGCGCCLEWAKRIEAAFGRRLTIVEASDMAAVKQARGVPLVLRSCHTAQIGALIVEGHVPPTDIRRLMARPDSTIRGLAVPGMPAGAPGMDVGPDRRDPYRVYAFGPRRAPFVYASYGPTR